MGVTTGDLSSIQGRVLSYQGQREFRSSQQGAMRWSQFRVPVGTPGGYGPWDSGSTGQEMKICKFPIGFAEEPMLDVMVALADGQTWDGSSFPAVSACAVTWRRIVEQQVFIGANVALSITGLGSAKGIATLTFYGPAFATPTSYTPEVEFSTSGPDWEMAEWLQQ